MTEEQIIRKWLGVKWRGNRNNLVRKFTQQACHTGPSRARFGCLSGQHSHLPCKYDTADRLKLYRSSLHVSDPSKYYIVVNKLIICTNNDWLRDSQITYFLVFKNKELTRRKEPWPQHFRWCAPAQTECTNMAAACSGSATHHVPYERNHLQMLRGPGPEKKRHEQWQKIVFRKWLKNSC